MAKRKKAKRTPIEEMVDIIEEVDRNMIEDRGGYLCKIDVVCDHIIVASDSDSGPDLEIFKPDEWRRRLAEIKDYMATEEDPDVVDAYHLTGGK